MKEHNPEKTQNAAESWRTSNSSQEAIDMEGKTADHTETVEPHPTSTFWSRLKQNKTRLALLVTSLVLVVLAAIVVPLVVFGLSEKTETQPEPTQIITPSSPDYHDPFDDSAQANPNSPPLNQKFRYNQQDRIRGINLGGWLVLEPFITPSLFESTETVDEWSLCQHLGPTEAERRLKEHYETFMTEADFKKIAEMGFNHVRIPTGHWAVQVSPDEPYVPYLSWQYLIRGIQWARKYGLRVMVELHTAPGSQNGWNHSGRAGQVGFLNGTQGEANADRTLLIAGEMVKFFNKPEWSNVVTLFGVLNEPAMMKIPSTTVKAWYNRSYDAIRKILGHGNGPLLTYHDGFMALKEWAGFFGKAFENVVLETHLYMIFNNGLVSMPREKQAEFPCEAWKKDIAEATLSGPTMVGEFSIATNDCAKYLNGVGLGARYDGTLDQEGAPTQPVCPTCSCVDVDDWRKFTPEYKKFLLQFMEKQMDAYEAGIGWFYWTYKTENHINPHWDYTIAYEQGFAPKDVNHRTFSCPV